jgi:hypothetical protein
MPCLWKFFELGGIKRALEFFAWDKAGHEAGDLVTAHFFSGFDTIGALWKFSSLRNEAALNELVASADRGLVERMRFDLATCIKSLIIIPYSKGVSL